MNILYILQQSIYGNDGKWKSSDSNINMMVGLFESLRQTSRWNDLQIDVVIGKLSDFSDISSFDELFKDERVKFIECNFPVDAFTNRQHFDVYFWKPLIDKDCDIIISNITEQSRNLKTLIETSKKKTKLITQCFWIDCPTIGEAKVPESYSYDWRQIDGYECSDLCVFTCESTKEAFNENARNKIFGCYIDNIMDKSVIWDFGFSVTEAEKYRVDKPLKDKKTILFLNRLSGINYTRHIEFIEAINKISKYRKDFEVVFTNPSGKIEDEWLKENCANVKLINSPLSRKDYWELLYTSDISFHGYTTERMGGCANTESIYCSNIVVMPQVYEYARRGGEAYPFYIDQNINSENIACVLNKALNSNNYNTSNMQQRNLDSSFEGQSEAILDSLFKLVEK